MTKKILAKAEAAATFLVLAMAMDLVTGKALAMKTDMGRPLGMVKKRVTDPDFATAMAPATVKVWVGAGDPAVVPSLVLAKAEAAATFLVLAMAMDLVTGKALAGYGSVQNAMCLMIGMSMQPGIFVMPELGHQLPFGNPPALAVGRCQNR